MKRILIYILMIFAIATLSKASNPDTIPTGFSRSLSWHIGAEATPSFIPGTNNFLKGNNNELKRVSTGLSGDIRGDFSFRNDTREGILYKGLYQGIGVGINSFFANSLLGTPSTLYIYQGAPIVHFSKRLWLGYEWRFGAAFGWKYYDEDYADDNSAVSTPVTAMLGLGFKLNYGLSNRWTLSLGFNGIHYSNGNTSWPNAGVNAIGASIGIAYSLKAEPQHVTAIPSWLAQEADKGKWMYDIMAYVAWRKRVVNVGDEPRLCSGRFGIVGLQFSPLRKLNRYVAVGPSLDMQWDESSNLEPYWVEGTMGADTKFERPPFSKQLSIGLSAHAELIMPIFSVNAGIGYGLVTPKGEKRFYQSLALKTFLTEKIFINVGYRLGGFKDPQNLMLGMGIRL